MKKENMPQKNLIGCEKLVTIFAQHFHYYFLGRSLN